LDEIKWKTGSYPLTLPVEEIGKPPELLENSWNYTATDSEFLFEYVDDPAGGSDARGVVEFDSKGRRWSDDR
jgi:hypothetical protein